MTKKYTCVWMSQEREGSQGDRTHFKVGSIIPEARGLDRIDVKKLTKEPSGSQFLGRLTAKWTAIKFKASLHYTE